MTEQDIEFLTTENENLKEFEKGNSNKLMRNSYTIKKRIEIADKSPDIVKNAEKRILGTFEVSRTHQDDPEPAAMEAHMLMITKMLEWKLTDVFPLFICTTFYLTVFFLAELTRKIVDMSVKKGTNFYIFAIELIATAQMCTCVYENGIMIKHYGISGFFFIVICLLYVGSLINRGAFVSPFAPIERFYYGTIKFDQLFLVLLAQAIGGYSAFRLANSLWFYSIRFSSDHHQFYENLPCTLNYKVPFFVAIAYEIIGCFLMRLIIPRLHTRYQPYIAPMITSAFLSFALAYIGVPALNPVTVSSRLQGCYGLDLQWFILTYWISPVIGWMAAAVLDHRAKLNVGGKSKKKK